MRGMWPGSLELKLIKLVNLICCVLNRQRVFCL